MKRDLQLLADNARFYNEDNDKNNVIARASSLLDAAVLMIDEIDEMLLRRLREHAKRRAQERADARIQRAAHEKERAAHEKEEQEREQAMREKNAATEREAAREAAAKRVEMVLLAATKRAAEKAADGDGSADAAVAPRPVDAVPAEGAEVPAKGGAAPMDADAEGGAAPMDVAAPTSAHEARVDEGKAEIVTEKKAEPVPVVPLALVIPDGAEGRVEKMAQDYAGVCMRDEYDLGDVMALREEISAAIHRRRFETDKSACLDFLATGEVLQILR